MKERKDMFDDDDEEDFDIGLIKKGDILDLSVRVNHVSSAGTLNCEGNINITQRTAGIIVDVDDSLKFGDLMPGDRLTNLPGHRLVYVGPSREEGFVICEDLDVDEDTNNPFGEYMFTALSLDMRPDEPVVYDTILNTAALSPVLPPIRMFEMTSKQLFDELFGYTKREQKLAEAA